MKAKPSNRTVKNIAESRPPQRVLTEEKKQLLEGIALGNAMADIEHEAEYRCLGLYSRYQ